MLWRERTWPCYPMPFTDFTGSNVPALPRIVNNSKDVERGSTWERSGECLEIGVFPKKASGKIGKPYDDRQPLWEDGLARISVYVLAS